MQDCLVWKMFSVLLILYRKGVLFAMKAVQIAEPNQLKIIDVDKPAIDDVNNVLVRMTAAGICGSDVGIYHGTNAAATYPRIIGHEMVGRVEETGTNVTHLKVGDRVIINQVTSCGDCYPCRIGRGNVCDNLRSEERRVGKECL